MSPSDLPPVRRQRATLLVASAGTLLALVDYTAPLTILGPTAATLHAGLTAQTWTLTGTLVSLAALLLTMGSAADDFGRKRVFAGGVALLAVSAVVSAAAPTTAWFLAGRVLQGCAAAAIMAPSLGLVGHAFPAGRERIRATGVWGAAVGLAIAIGPVYAALVQRAAGWRAVYGVLAVACAALLVVTLVTLTESRAGHRRRLDPAGVLTLAAGTSALITGLAEARSGWGRPVVLVPLALGVLLLAAFVLVEWRLAEPMLDPRLLRSPGFLVSCAGALFTGMSIVGLMSYLPSVFQRSLAMTPLAAGLLLAVWSGLSFLSALQARRLASRLSAITQVAGSLLLCGIGEAALFGMHAGGGWARLLPGLVITGVGSGVLNAALARLAVASVPAERAAMGSGANNTARYVGSALGVAIVVTVVSQARSAGGPAAAMAHGANSAALVAAALCAVGALVAVYGMVAEHRPQRAPAPADREKAVAHP